MGEDWVSNSSPYSFTSIFEKHLPYYLSMGMPYDLFWYGEPKAVISFRKARELEIDNQNTMAWLQGMYIYQALCNVSPIFRDFAKKGTKPIPYPNEPYALNDSSDEMKENKEMKLYEKQKASLNLWVSKTNAYFKQKGVKDNGKQHD